MRRLAPAVLTLGLLAVACGGDDDTGNRPDPPVVEPVVTTPTGLADAADAARDIIDRAVADTPDDARATVVVDGTTYEFRPLIPGPDDDFYSFCTVIAGSLQGGMQLVDDTGARVEGGELEFILLEPGGAYAATGDPAELMIVLPEYDGIGFTDEQIDAPASGRRAAGTFTVSNHLGDALTGTIDASC
ncbi:MAG TPA: hypothetical protein VNQ73_06070 [Ilumatobacter sp.]|nr:hypothetical protein [Ilumatobacter sp.]